MKKTAFALLSVLTVCLAVPASAAKPGSDLGELRNYAKRAVTRCPDSVLTLTPIPGQGPSNFQSFELLSKSKDDSCTTHKFLFYSPTTQQIVIGSAFVLPQDKRPVNERLTEQAHQLLKADVTTSVSPFPLPDGLKAVTISKDTEYGPFSYEGYVDASDRFLIIGTRGNLRIDAGKSLRDALRVDATAVRRGNPKAKVEIIEFSDFECPTCARAHKTLEPLITKNLSKVNFGRIDFPLFEHHPWALPAALGARAIRKVAPSEYWSYVDFVFNNQETIDKMPFDKVLQNFCQDHDIPWAKVLPVYHSATERQALLEEVGRAFDNGLDATPTFMINGQIIAYGPEGATMFNAIKAALGVK